MPSHSAFVRNLKGTEWILERLHLGNIFNLSFLHNEETKLRTLLNSADVYVFICCLYRMPEIHLCEDINKLHVDSASDLFGERF